MEEIVKTRVHKAGSMLILVAGIVCIIFGVGMAIFPDVVTGFIPRILDVTIISLGAVVFIVGIIELLGGYYAYKRQRWTLVIGAGALGTLCLNPLSLLGTIFIGLSEREFRS